MYNRKIGIYLLVLLASMIFSGCTKQTLTFNIAMPDTIKTLDPQYATSSAEKTVIANIFAHLTRYDNNGEFQLYAADGYSVSDDKLLHTFTIDKNLHWQNMEQLTAHDYVYAIERIYGGSPYAQTLKALGINAIAKDNHTLEISLEKPMADIRHIFAESYTAPCNEDFLISTKGKYGLTLETTPSSGTYKLQSKGDSYAVLEGNTDTLKDTKIKISTGVSYSPDEQINLFNSGKLDIIYVDEDATKAIKKPSDTAIITLENTVTVLAFNTQSNIFSNIELRRAFTPSNAVFSSAEGILLPKDVGSAENIFKPVDIDITEFRNILTELGLTELPSLKFIVTDTYKTVATEYAKNKNNTLGTLISPQVLTGNDFKTALESGGFDIAIYTLTGSSNDAVGFLSYFLAGHPKNYTKVSNEELTTALHEKNVKSAQQILADNYYLYPIAYPKEYIVARKSLGTFIQRAGIYYFGI